MQAISNKIIELKEQKERPQERPGKKPAFLDRLVGLFLDGEQLSIEEIREQTDTFMAAVSVRGWSVPDYY